MKIQLFDIISIAAVGSYFIPLVIVLLKKLWREPFFMWFAAYWSLGGLVNMTDVLPGVPKNISYMVGVLYNMFDIPFILAILYCTTSSVLVKKCIPPAIVLILSASVASLIVQGVNYDSLKYPLGAGIAMVLLIVSSEILRYMQKIEHSNRQNSKMFIYAAVLFEYATFIVIYVSDYFITTSNTKDSYLIYYFSTLGAILIASCGYLLFRKYEKNTPAY